MSGVRIFASQAYRLRTLTVPVSMLVAVQRGTKTVLGALGEARAQSGELLLLAQGTQWDVINDPQGQARYEAWVLCFPHEMLAALPEPDGSAHVVRASHVLAMDQELEGAISRNLAIPGQAAPSERVAAHRLQEVLLLLAERGVYFAALPDDDWLGKVKRLVAQRPHADWSVDALARAFHTSPSTLRRRLAGSGSSLAALVREVRLETALQLLQSSRLSVGDVASRCGWDSHSRFSAAFQKRWGVAPSVVRGSGNVDDELHQKKFDPMMTHAAQRMSASG